MALDRVLLVVANVPWQKVPEASADDRDATATSGGPHGVVASAADRLAMVEAACAGRPGLEASALEIERGGTTYTVDTVEELRAAPSPPSVHLVIGADLVPTLSTWHRVDDLRRMVRLAVVSRPGAPEPEGLEGWDHDLVTGVDVPASSSEVRQRLAAGESLDGLVPEEVIRCIGRRALYAEGR